MLKPRYLYMRYIYILILLGINYSVFSQAKLQINFGQKNPNTKDVCLVIKNKTKALKNIKGYVPLYKSVSSLKFVNFNEHNIDSVLYHLSQLTSVKEIIFENCNLDELETSFENYKLLDKIVIKKKSTIYENTFFTLIKNNQISQLFLETRDPDLALDSLYLLSQIKTIAISNNGKFLNSNYSKKIQLENSDGKIQQIELSFFDDFYKPIKTTAKPTTTEPIKKNEITKYQNNLSCIKQPIPGININDTLYQFYSTQRVDFTYKSGSSISFYPNSFTTQTGEKYTGPVKIFYREFRNPVEIMLSGIPMTNKDEQGNINLFKSGGMYQINAFDNNDMPLNTVSDTAIKINFALTDTSRNFQFYNLNNNGSWSTLTPSISIINAKSNKDKYTKAVIEYFAFIRNLSRIKADTTKYERRFYNNDYLYTYRKDNFSFFDSLANEKDKLFFKKEINKKAFFKIKYIRQTKDKEIVYKVVPVKKGNYVPSYIWVLFNKDYVYRGNLSKEQFKKTYNRKNIFWDVRTTTNDNIVNLDMKALNSIESISGEVIYLKEDRTYIIPKKQGKIVNVRIARFLKREAKSFNKDEHIHSCELNKLNLNVNKNKEKLAYKHSLQFQNNDEKKLTYEEWQKYVSVYANLLNPINYISNDNQLGTALLKSGLGVKNIDCYIHSGKMQNVLVQYKNQTIDSLSGQYHVFLYTAINTSFPLNAYYGENKLSGYYYKKHNNYIIRFSGNGIMQVTKPNIVSGSMKGDEITLDYINQYNVKGMNSAEITRLILH